MDNKWSHRQDEEWQRARDPGCSAAELLLLSQSLRAAVRGAVVGNPNCPAELLRPLGIKHPSRLMANPAIDLWLLAEPQFFSRFTADQCAAMARSPALTPAGAAALAGLQHHVVGVSLAENRVTPPAVLASLCLSWWHPVRAAASRHPRTPRRTLALLRAAGASPTLVAIQPRPRRAAPLLSRVAALGGWGAEVAASSPWCPAPLLWQLAEGRGYEPLPSVFHRDLVKEAIAINPSASREVLCLLAAAVGPKDDLLVEKLLTNPALPTETRESLVRWVREHQ